MTPDMIGSAFVGWIAGIITAATFVKWNSLIEERNRLAKRVKELEAQK
jgi:hypothetical protein